MAITMAYDKEVKGWTSEYSYIPDSGVSLNNNFYTFNNGRIWLHNSEGVTRNTFYGLYEPTEIVFIFNDQPSSVKNFKTVAYEGIGDWRASVETNLEKGDVAVHHFANKEGRNFAFIRGANNNFDPDLKSSNIGGIDIVESANNRGIWDATDNYEVYDSVTFTDSEGIITNWVRTTEGITPTSPNMDSDNWTSGRSFNFLNIPDSLSVNDLAYVVESNTEKFDGDPLLAGRITDRRNNSLILDDSVDLVGNSIRVPNVGDLLFYVKDNTVEKSGLLGFYSIVTLVNDQRTDAEIDEDILPSETNVVEIFSIGSEAFISTK